MNETAHGIMTRVAVFFGVLLSLLQVCWGASAADIASALESPAGITFSSSNGGWSRKTGSVSNVDLSGITSVGNDYLVATAPSKAAPRSAYSFTMSFKGSGYLNFRYKVSLDDTNSSELCMYNGTYDDYNRWSISGWAVTQAGHEGDQL